VPSGVAKMRDDERLDSIKFDLLTEGGEDFLGLWEFLWEVHEILGITDAEDARAKTLGIIRGYLEEGLIAPGFPIENGPDFAAWDLPPDETIAMIVGEWDRLEREPVMGDILWFITTDRGKEWLQSHRKALAGETTTP
jgi:hypothetical protein